MSSIYDTNLNAWTSHHCSFCAAVFAPFSTSSCSPTSLNFQYFLIFETTIPWLMMDEQCFDAMRGLYNAHSITWKLFHWYLLNKFCGFHFLFNFSPCVLYHTPSSQSWPICSSHCMRDYFGLRLHCESNKWTDCSTGNSEYVSPRHLIYWFSVSFLSQR